MEIVIFIVIFGVIIFFGIRQLRKTNGVKGKNTCKGGPVTPSDKPANKEDIQL